VKVLVCGDRHWHDPEIVWTVLDGVEATRAPRSLTVVEGGATGADQAAREWTGWMSKHETYPADWDKYGKRAGPIRNQRMLDEAKPHMVVAFHNDLAASKGTKDMVQRAKAAGIPVYLVSTL